MTVAITRMEHTAAELRRDAVGSATASIARRLLALALILDGHKREDAARAGGVKPKGLPDMDRQTLRDWVHRYNAAGLAGLSDRHGGGAQSRLSPEREVMIADWIRAGPDVAMDGVIRWRCLDIQARIAREWGITLHKRSVAKSGKALALPRLHRLHLACVSTRPRHPKADVTAQASFGPAALRDRRRHSADLFGAVCAAAEQRFQRDRGVGAALVLPYANADAMSLRLAEISRHVVAGAQAVVVLDGAGWRQTGGRLCVPGNLSLYGRDARNAITGITLFAGFASTVGWPASAATIDAPGWRGALLGWAALHLLIGWPFDRLLVPKAPLPAPVVVSEGAAPSDAPWTMVILASVFGATWFVSAALATHLPRLLDGTQH